MHRWNEVIIATSFLVHCKSSINFSAFNGYAREFKEENGENSWNFYFLCSLEYISNFPFLILCLKWIVKIAKTQQFQCRLEEYFTVLDEILTEELLAYNKTKCTHTYSIHTQQSPCWAIRKPYLLLIFTFFPLPNLWPFIMINTYRS